MADRGTDIQTVYEPGFGSMGKPEENIMVEKPVGLYGLSDKTIENCQKLMDNNGIEASPKNLILFADSNKEQRSAQGESALDSSIFKLMKESNFPKVQRRKELGESRFQVQEMSPLTTLVLSATFTKTDDEANAKIPLQSILLCKTNGASDAEYIQATIKIIKEANKTLQIFNSDFRIPQLPSDGEITKV